jgi:hypothetical protein
MTPAGFKRLMEVYGCSLDELIEAEKIAREAQKDH